MEYLSIVMFVAVCLVLMAGYPVAYSLAGTSLVFASIGIVTGYFDGAYLGALPNRIYGIMINQTLLAVPLFVLMGVMLEKSQVAEKLLTSMGQVMGQVKGGLAIAVVMVGMLLAASTGIVGATVVTMGLLSLPTMLKRGYSASFATGTICATGTLGQIIPPSIALVLLGDVLSSAYQQAQIKMGIFSPETVSVGDLFAGALVPGLILVTCYLLYVFLMSWLNPKTINQVIADEAADEASPLAKIALLRALFPPLLLIFAVLGSILLGLATPTEAAGVGAFGATLLAFIQGNMTKQVMADVVQATLKITCMVFMILIGASVFSLVFRGFGGEDLIHELFNNMPGGAFGAMLVVMLVVFLLGFILDFIEITFVVVPIVGPVLLAMGFDPVWLGIMFAVNLQTSFLTPPFGFALFYLRGVAPESVATKDIYRGVAPYIAIQLVVLMALAMWPSLVTWLPDQIYK
ncbi:TRAP transporter large permease subunit [Motilimonas cestriensis]|uniref:TRAP transporter large permease protein n=1 Tax=Motilimonas cestriensis TaxID=2742685 RepID=A0ABS8W3U5_9GAMM|nr:TRAP transporter large permease subunit [Motilimonas cestriensis]MCE2593609.1 TRAP transporter large permease subunit [Motilimonas cestriensis]